jgi:dTDP-4-amino-4,6-dideoxygalactose transaminase
MDELHAAIGLAQLKKLPSIVRRRRHLVASFAQGCAQRLKTVRLVGDPPWAEASFWFLLFRLDLKALEVDKARFVEALVAEGVPVGASYLFCPAAAPWFARRVVFGASGRPWSDASAAPTPMTKLPNILATDATHFRLMFHENWTDREVEDVLTALEKVERAYLR